MCAGKVNVVNLMERLRKLEECGRSKSTNALRRSGTPPEEKVTKHDRSVEAYIGLKDTRTTDDTRREHRKKTGELERRQGAHLRNGLMQGISKNRDLAGRGQGGRSRARYQEPRQDQAAQWSRDTRPRKESHSMRPSARQGKELIDQIIYVSGRSPSTCGPNDLDEHAKQSDTKPQYNTRVL